MADKAFKTRGKRCEIHGILYDPELTSGCVRCRRGGFRRASSPKFLSLLITLLALTAVAAYVINGALTGIKTADDAVPRTAEATAPPAASRVAKIDPGLFEGHIRAIEDALFDPDESDFAVVTDRVASEASGLEAALRQASMPATVLSSVSDFAAATRDAAATVAAVQSTRDRWVRLRGAVFRPASWMTSGRARANTGKLAARSHLDIAQALIAAVLGASNQPPDSAEDEDEDDRAALVTEAAALQARMPSSPPLDADPRLLAGRRALDQMLTELGTLATRPASQERRAELEDLAARASATQAELETLLGS